MNGKAEKKFKKMMFIVEMLFIPTIHLIVFFFYLNIDAILMAFKVEEHGQIRWTLENFTRFFGEFQKANSQIPESLKNTMIFFFSDLLIKFPLSVIVCYFLYKKVSGYKTFRFIFYMPCIISGTIYVVLFKYVIGMEGPVGLLFGALGKDPIPFLSDSRYALNTIVFYTIWSGIGANIVVLGGAFNHIDDGIIEAAAIDGANMRCEFFKIIIPMIWPTLSTMLILSFVGIFSASGPILLFTGGAYKTYTISYWLYYQVLTYGAKTYYPMAVGLVFTLIGAPIALFMRWLANKIPSYDN